MKICVVVPHFNHLEQFQQFLPNLIATGLPIVVVDDASDEETIAALEVLLARTKSDVQLVRHSENRGKGGAVKTGLHTAFAAGFSHAIQNDADGQHDCSDIPAFLEASQARPEYIICGQPVFDESISGLRYYARYITLSLSWLETLSFAIKDAMCGLRLYPLATTTAILDNARLGERMAFDPELLVRAVWSGIPLHYIPIKVVYPEDGQSHFHYLNDNLEISWMHTRLIIGMLFRSPVLLARRLGKS